MNDIKIIAEPSVYLVSSPILFNGTIHQFLKEQGIEHYRDTVGRDGELLPEIAGRLCYMSYSNPRPGGNEAYLKHILEVGHESVLEHSNYGFIFTGISRSLSHELVRHRVGLSPSQLSQRYVDESDVAFVLPPALQGSYHCFKSHRHYTVAEELLAQDERCRKFLAWKSACVFSISYYRELLSLLEVDAPQELTGTEQRKWARQAARSVLPNCTETKIMVTGNLRAWRHAILLRASRHADDEIRRLFNKIYNVLSDEVPHVLQDLTTEPLPDGTFEVLKGNK